MLEFISFPSEVHFSQGTTYISLMLMNFKLLADKVFSGFATN